MRRLPAPRFGNRRRVGALRVALTACLVLATAAQSGASTPDAASRAPASGAFYNSVILWEANSEAAVSAAGILPPEAQLTYAMVQGAVYDAIDGIVRSYHPYLVHVPGHPGDSQDAAVATAAFEVLAYLYPAQLVTLRGEYAAALSAIRHGAAKFGGIADGAIAATAMIVARRNDGRNANVPVTIGTDPGQWRPTPPGYFPPYDPWLGQVKPFLVPDVSMLALPGPNGLTSAAYARDLNEVRSVGSANSATRTQAQTDTALFWQFSSNQLGSSASMQTLASGHGLSIADTARMSAMVHLASADSIIGCFNQKYYWMFWRPVTAIREAGTDGNPDTVGDPNWNSLIDTPPHPDYPAGHTCVAGATSGALTTFFGTPDVSFTSYDDLNGATRTYESFPDVVQEVINARVWGGIHTRTAGEAGAALGAKVAAWEAVNYFRPLLNQQ